MNVRQLITLLEECDPDMMVVVSRDSEGNGFSPLHDINGDEYSYDPDDREIHLHTLTDELREYGYTEEDIREDGERCVVLWP